MVNLLLIDDNFISLNWIKMIENKEKKILFHHDEQKDSTTYITFFNDWGIHVLWDWYDRWRLKNLSEIVCYNIQKGGLDKLMKIIETENPDLESRIDIERCKNRIWEEDRNNLWDRERKIYSIFDAMFYEIDAYAVIYDYIREKGIHYDWYWADII